METKNANICNYAESLLSLANEIKGRCGLLGDSYDENQAIIKIIDIYMTAIESQRIILQTALDEY